MKAKLLAAILLTALFSTTASAQRLQQTLGRGVVAVKHDNNVLISWRKQAQEPENTQYNVYVNGTKQNPEPLTKTNYRTTTAKVPNGAAVTVATVIGGKEGPQSKAFTYKTPAWNNVAYRIDFEKKVLNPNEYKAKYAWPADLDGDGEYEWIVDRLSTTSISTRSHKLQAYKTDGTCLWTIDMGPNMNIDAGQDDMVLAYDINCDGKAEVIVKSSDGTRFWDSTNATWGKYVHGKDNADTDGDGITDYSKQTKRNPPFYITVVDGMTGSEITSAELDYSQVHDGADQYSRSNRENYMSDGDWLEYASLCGHFAICYFDGIHPSLAMEVKDRTANGTHHYYLFAFGYDWNGGTPANWHHTATFSRNDKQPWPAEFHMVRVCDVDGDGIDELLTGGYGWNPTKGMVMNAQVGHGDRFRLSDINPDRPGLECFAIQQSGLMGQVLYDAATGEHLREWYLPSVFDVGRGECMDVDPNHKGYEIYSTLDGLYDCKGDLIKAGSTSYPFEGVWWDGDLQREVLNSPGGSGFSTNAMITKYDGTRLIQQSRESGWQVFVGTAVRPLFFGDILGDWREEVAMMIQNDDTSTGMVVYSTDYETDHSFYCLQEDPHYRLDCTTKGYYQSPNTTFYLGGEMPMPQLPPCMVTDVVVGSSTLGSGSTHSNYQRNGSATFTDGQSVLIDLTSPEVVNVEGTVKPSVLYAMTVKGQNVTLQGGSLEGDMQLWKSQQGTLTLATDVRYTGSTIVSEGTLLTHQNLTATTIDLRARGTLAGSPTVGKMVLEGALNHEGGRLAPEAADSKFGTMTFANGLDITQPLFMEMDVQTVGEVKTDVIHVEGDINIGSTLTINVKTDDAKLQAGEYKLVEYTGELKGDAGNITVMGLMGLSYSVKAENGGIVLVINAQRAPASGVAWTGSHDGIWDYKTENWTLGGQPTMFVAQDNVLFGDEAKTNTVTLTEMMPVSGVTVDNNTLNYTFSGDGGLTGEGGLTKTGEGRLTINNTKSTYTGPTIIDRGIVIVKEVADGGKPSSLGAATADAANWQIGRAMLTINNSNAATDRAITLTDSAVVQVPSGGVTLKGKIVGNGSLTKMGNGQLTIGYGGTNTWSGGTTLMAGTLAMGSWNSTFGPATSPITANGGTIVVFDNNSTSAVPTFRNKLTVPAGKTVTMKGGSRCKIQGSLLGQGTLNIGFPYVRGDFEMNTSNFEGTLNVSDGGRGNFRITSATDLSKATLVLNAGVYAAHFASQGGSETSLTTKVGSLRSTAADATLSTGTWNVGYLGRDDSFAGKVTGTLNKYGDGSLEMTGASTGAINVYAGTLLANNTAAAITSGLVTVRQGGTLSGCGRVQRATVQTGGALAAKKSGYSVATLTILGTLTMANGSTINVNARRSASEAYCDAFAVAGNITLNNITIDVNMVGDNLLQEGDELKIFTGAGTITANGTITLSPAQPAPGLLWDTTSFATDGTIRVVADPDAIRYVDADGTPATIYDINGRKVNNTKLKRGVYIVNGKKVVVKD